MARAASHWRTGGVRPDATHAVAPLRHARSRHAAGPALGSLRSARRDSLMDLEYRRPLALSRISERWTARALVERAQGRLPVPTCVAAREAIIAGPLRAGMPTKRVSGEYTRDHGPTR